MNNKKLPIGKKSKENLSTYLSFSIALLMLFFSGIAYCAAVDVGIGHGEFTVFEPLLVIPLEKKSADMQSAIALLVENTFIILATIDLCWAAAIWSIEKDNMSSFTAELIQKIMTISFFYGLLQMGPKWIHLIPDTFIDIGAKAGGFTSPTVDGIFATGLAVVDAIWKIGSYTDIIKIITNIHVILVAILVTIVVIVCYGIAAIQFLAVKIETTVLLACGMVFLAFGGSQWTKEYVDKYMTYAITAGMRYLVILVILGLLQGLIVDLINNIPVGSLDITSLLKIMVFGIVTAMMTLKAPEMANALMMGGNGFTAGAMKSSAKSLAPAVTTPAKLAAKGVAGTYNAGKMVSAGIKNARAEGKGGGAAIVKGLGSAAKMAGKEGFHSLGQKLQGKSAQGGGFLHRGAAGMKDKLNADGATVGKGGASRGGGVGGALRGGAGGGSAGQRGGAGGGGKGTKGLMGGGNGASGYGAHGASGHGSNGHGTNGANGRGGALRGGAGGGGAGPRGGVVGGAGARASSKGASGGQNNYRVARSASGSSSKSGSHSAGSYRSMGASGGGAKGLAGGKGGAFAAGRAVGGAVGATARAAGKVATAPFKAAYRFAQGAKGGASAALKRGSSLSGSYKSMGAGSAGGKGIAAKAGRTVGGVAGKVAAAPVKAAYRFAQGAKGGASAALKSGSSLSGSYKSMSAGSAGGKGVAAKAGRALGGTVGKAGAMSFKAASNFAQGAKSGAGAAFKGEKAASGGGKAATAGQKVGGAAGGVARVGAAPAKAAYQFVKGVKNGASSAIKGGGSSSYKSMGTGSGSSGGKGVAAKAGQAVGGAIGKAGAASFKATSNFAQGAKSGVGAAFKGEKAASGGGKAATAGQKVGGAAGGVARVGAAPAKAAYQFVKGVKEGASAAIKSESKPSGQGAKGGAPSANATSGNVPSTSRPSSPTLSSRPSAQMATVPRPAPQPQSSSSVGEKSSQKGGYANSSIGNGTSGGSGGSSTFSSNRRESASVSTNSSSASTSSSTNTPNSSMSSASTNGSGSFNPTEKSKNSAPESKDIDVKESEKGQSKAQKYRLATNVANDFKHEFSQSRHIEYSNENNKTKQGFLSAAIRVFMSLKDKLTSSKE